MHWGFSYMGLLFLLMLMLPNLLWIKRKPKGYEEYAARENRLLAALERLGEVLVSGTVLIFSDFNPCPPIFSPWNLWLLAALTLMALYEYWWVRYFASGKTMADFYSSLLGIPVAGATLPVLAFLALGIYGKHPPLILFTLALGVGHIGIHLGHLRDV